MTVLVIVLGALAATWRLEIGAIGRALIRADPGILLVAAGLYAVSWPMRGWRYREILGSMDHRGSTGLLTGVVFLSQAANILVPARAGDGLRAYVLKQRLAIPYAAGVASLLVERVLDLFVVTTIAVGTGAWLLRWGGLEGLPVDGRLLGIAVLSVAVVLGVGTIVVASSRRWAWRLPDRIEAWLSNVLVATRQGLTDRSAIGSILVASGAIWVLDVLVGVLVAAAVIDVVPVGEVPALAGTVGLAVSAGNLAKSVPATHGGIGLYEVAFAGMLTAATPLSPELALAIAILDHGIKNAITLAGGFAATFALFGRVPRSLEELDRQFFRST